MQKALGLSPGVERQGRGREREREMQENWRIKYRSKSESRWPQTLIPVVQFSFLPPILSGAHLSFSLPPSHPSFLASLAHFRGSSFPLGMQLQERGARHHPQTLILLQLDSVKSRSAVGPSGSLVSSHSVLQSSAFEPQCKNSLETLSQANTPSSSRVWPWCHL